MLPCSMFSSPNPPISFLNYLAPALFFPSSASAVTQTLPAFSTAGKHSAHSNPCNSSRFLRVLHTSHHPPDGGRHFQSTRLLRSPFRFRHPAPPPPTPLTPLEATLTQISTAVDSKSLTEILSRFYATFTKNTGGWRPSSLRRLCALCASALSFPSSALRFPLVSPSSRRFPIHSRFKHGETHPAPLASHYMHAVPCGGSIKNQMSETKSGGDCA